MAQHPIACPLDCPDACGILAEVDAQGRLTRVRGNPDHPWSRGSLCSKTAAYADVVHSERRLRTPLWRDAAGELVPCTWDQALDRIAERVRGLPGERILSLSYAGNMGQIGRRVPLRVMHALGATETDGAICDSSAEEGHALVLGDAIGVHPDELDTSDVLVLWGCDARRTHQHWVPRVKRLLDRGGRAWVIDVYRSDTVEQLERWGARSLVLEPGSDAALALWLADTAFREGRVDLARLKDACVGAAEFRAHVAGAWPTERAAACTGLDPRDLHAFAEDLLGAERPFWKTGIGFTRRRNGGMSMRAVCSAAAVLGHEDRLHFQSGDHFGLDVRAVEREDLRPRPRDVISHVALGLELERRRFGAVFVWGHNPAVTVPDSARVRRALADPDLFLVVHELFRTETAELADVVLPATAFTEHTDLLRSYGHRVLHVSRAASAPVGEARSNVEAFAAIGERLGLPREVWDVDAEGLVRRVLADSRARFTGDEHARLLTGEPVELAPRPRPDRGTPSGRVELFSTAAEALGQPPMADHVPDDGADGTGRFRLLMTPSVATHNSSYTGSERHRARAGEGRVYVHPDDARELGLGAGSPVTLRNEQGALTLPVAVDERARPGIVRLVGFPLEAFVPEGVGVNVLTPPAKADLGDGSSLYSTRVDLVPVRAAQGAGSAAS